MSTSVSPANIISIDPSSALVFPDTDEVKTHVITSDPTTMLQKLCLAYRQFKGNAIPVIHTVPTLDTIEKWLEFIRAAGFQVVVVGKSSHQGLSLRLSHLATKLLFRGIALVDLSPSNWLQSVLHHYREITLPSRTWDQFPEKYVLTFSGELNTWHNEWRQPPTNSIIVDESGDQRECYIFLEDSTSGNYIQAFPFRGRGQVRVIIRGMGLTIRQSCRFAITDDTGRAYGWLRATKL